MRVSIDVRKILKDLKVFEKKINYAIEQVVIEYVTDFVFDLAKATPLGNPEERDPMSRYYKLYELRNKIDGYRIQGGLARGNWRVAFREGTNYVVQQYNDNPSNTSDAAFAKMDDNYKLGKPIYIVNNVKYINKLREGYSPQAPAGTIDAVMDNYRSLTKYRNIFKNALAGA